MSEHRWRDATRMRGEDKRRSVAAMFDAIADRYDLLNVVLSLGATSLWRRRALADLAPPRAGRVLDVGCGTGAVPRLLRPRRPDLSFEALDVSEAMLVRARQRDPETEYFAADAAAIPRPDARFDLVTSCYTTRNFGDLDRAAAEMIRVLRPGGTVVVLDAFPVASSWLAWFHALWMERIVPAVVAPFTDAEAYRYLAASIRDHVPPQRVADALREGGATDVQIRRHAMGIARIRATKAEG
jgi:demethylmenaquinone methyltransferase / 2-methoxy-6-polyprenyl-1,4-benzoquinol methylase